MISKHLFIASLCFLIALLGFGNLLYWIFFLLACLLGCFIHLLFHQDLWTLSYQSYRSIRTSFVQRKLISHIDDSDLKSTSKVNERVPLTGIPVIDEPLHEAIDLFARDYIEVWYKTQISSDESFIEDVKNGIYITIRHLTERLREIDWLEFCTGTVVDSFATHVRLYRLAKERMRNENSTDIRASFFDVEAEYERGICRDDHFIEKPSLIDHIKEFLRDMVEVLIYILLPANEFRCVPARLLIREVTVNLGLVPFIDMYTDPDAINQLIIRMCQQIPLTIDNFLLVARTTDSRAELSALAERLDHEISRWRSKDTGGENDADIRATLQSYNYLKRLLSERLEKQVHTPILDDDEVLQKVTFHDLPLTEILNNCNGLDYFLKFLQTIDAVGYANFYLNAEAFRCAGLSVQQQNNSNTTPEQHQANIEVLRNMAFDLIEQYFLPTGTFKLPIDENLIQKTLRTLKSDAIDETLLDELQMRVFELLSSEKFYGQFKTTPQYLKVLSEIDFSDSLTDNSDSVSLSSNHSNELSNDFSDHATSSGIHSNSGTSVSSASSVGSDLPENLNQCLLTTEINDSVTFVPLNAHGQALEDLKREWITYRRFSEFNDLNMTIRKRYPDLRDLPLPNKSLVNNTSAEVRMKRQKELNDYLTALTKPKVLQSHPQLGELLLKFLKNQQWKHEQTELARKMDTIVNPFKQASMGLVKGVSSLPGNVAKSVSKIGDGLAIVSDSVVENAGKIFRTNPNNTNTRPGIHLTRDIPAFSMVEENQADNSKNIPLRVLLVIMDEVFDLKQKNMWFRSRFVSILKRFLRAFMGDSVNRRITVFVQHWTSATKIAKEITRLKDEFWPNGILADKAPERDATVRNITQVLCKAKLLGIVSDELRHIIGSETTRRGLLRLFELLQNETLNRRFVYIVIEALLIKLFRPNHLHLLFEKLYSSSARVKEEYRRRILERDHSQNGFPTNQHHHLNEMNPRPYYLNHLSVRTDDPYTNLSRSMSNQQQQQMPQQQQKILPRSFSKISR